MCFMGWLMELVGTAINFFSPALRSYGFHNVNYPDAIIMFILIPFIHIMNDETIKGIVMERGWVQGLRHILAQQNIVRPE